MTKLVNLLQCFTFFFTFSFPRLNYNLHSKSKWQRKWFKFWASIFVSLSTEDLFTIQPVIGNRKKIYTHLFREEANQLDLYPLCLLTKCLAEKLSFNCSILWVEKIKNNHLTQLNFTKRETEVPRIQLSANARNEKYDTGMKTIHSADFREDWRS